MKANHTTDRALNLRAGEWAEVRAAQEILGTLDQNQCLAGLPFMPEMLPYCGKRFRVYKSAHKTCDTIHTFCIRSMENTVHLEGLRCDGEAHGGCQAGCLIFWKEAWLKRVADDGVHSKPGLEFNPDRVAVDASALFATTRQPWSDGKVRYRCQTTELPNATKEVRRRDRWDPRFYWKDLTSRNVTLWEFVRFGAFAVLNSFLIRWFGHRYPRLCGRASGKTPALELNLQPGELVRVRTKEEIVETLNKQLRNRGLGFDVEMVPFCENGTYRVLRRVKKIINEKSGEMMELPNPCLVLDGVVCSGNYSFNRMFCPRAIYPYFREIWLKRAGGASAPQVEQLESCSQGAKMPALHVRKGYCDGDH